ncbi:hypothetical protein OIO90_001526 [Microbotryomycetes sp. JL221]|nr:hypothetical protein OIO90_001526 [Microbotryomycetes sp. JL221]
MTLVTASGSPMSRVSVHQVYQDVDELNTARRQRPTTRVLGAAATGAPLPSSTSESALAPATQDNKDDGQAKSKRKGIKPFILRSTTAVAPPTSPNNGTGLRDDARHALAAPVKLEPSSGTSSRRIARAKSVPGQLNKKVADENVPPVPTINYSKHNASTKPKRPPRSTTPHTPRRAPSIAIATGGQSTTHVSPSHTSGPVDAHTVEQHKINLKRSSLISRRTATNPGEEGPSAARKWLSAITGSHSEQVSSRAVTKSLAWPSQSAPAVPTQAPLEGLESTRRQSNEHADQTNGSHRVFSRGAAPSEGSSLLHQTTLSLIAADGLPSEESSGSDSSATVVPGRLARSRNVKQASNPTFETPTRPNSSASNRSNLGLVRTKSREGKRRSVKYGELARPKSFDSRTRSSQIKQEEYTSMQEMLESSGFADVRVITPQAPVRTSKAPLTTATAIPAAQSSGLSHPLATSLAESHHFSDTNCFGSPSSLAPPLSMQHKASMLSLRGLFSLWRADEEGEVPEADEDAPNSAEADLTDLPTDDMTPERRNSMMLQMQQWADTVSREVATLSASPAIVASTSSVDAGSLAARASLHSLTAHSSVYGPSSRPPSLHPSLSNISVSSSTSLSSSQRHLQRPPSVHSLARETALRSLIHVVSDPALGGATTTGLRTSVHGSPRLGGYQSFALTGIVPWGMTVDHDTWGQSIDLVRDDMDAESDRSRLSVASVRLGGLVGVVDANAGFGPTSRARPSSMRVEYDDVSDEQERRLDAHLKRLSNRMSIQSRQFAGARTSKSFDSMRRRSKLFESIGAAHIEQLESTTNHGGNGGGFWSTLKNKASGAFLGWTGGSTTHDPMPQDFQVKLSHHRSSLELNNGDNGDTARRRPQLIRKAVSAKVLKPKLSVEEFDWDEVVRCK